MVPGQPSSFAGGHSITRRFKVHIWRRVLRMVALGLLSWEGGGLITDLNRSGRRDSKLLLDAALAGMRSSNHG